jgi:hypothetical protein
VIPFDDLGFMFISDPVKVEQIRVLTLDVPVPYDQVRSVTRLLRGHSLCLRIIGSILRLSEGALSKVCKRSLMHRLPN